jgi:hypothetical protein
MYLAKKHLEKEVAHINNQKLKVGKYSDFRLRHFSAEQGIKRLSIA